MPLRRNQSSVRHGAPRDVFEAAQRNHQDEVEDDISFVRSRVRDTFPAKV